MFAMQANPNATPTPAQQLGGILRKLIDRRGLLQRDVAGDLGVHPSLISHWVAGRAEPTLEDLRKLALLLDVPVKVLAVEPAPVRRTASTSRAGAATRTRRRVP